MFLDSNNDLSVINQDSMSYSLTDQKNSKLHYAMHMLCIIINYFFRCSSIAIANFVFCASVPATAVAGGLFSGCPSPRGNSDFGDCEICIIIITQ